METIKLIILAVVQGATELLPVSSSAHLLLVSQLLDFEADTLFMTTLHFGTTVAILLYFWKTLFKDFFKKKKLPFYLKIIAASIPAGLVGFLLQDTIENIFRSNIYISVSLILWGIVMIILENSRRNIESSVEKVGWKDALVMGFAQIIALIPGTSRSGITSIAGILSGVNKYTALQFSFLLGIPVLLGASVYEFFKEIPNQPFHWQEILGMFVAGIVGYIFLKLLERFKKSKWLTFFGIYRIILGLIVLATILF
jgi:undecaprenyl-diphosphatase